MPDASFTSLAIVVAVAFLARLLLGLLPRLRVPGVVIEIVLGIAIGPAVLGWAELDAPVEVLSIVGLAFLLFLSGLELEVDELRGAILRLAVAGLAASVALALAAGVALDATGLVDDPLLIGVTLIATSLGLVVPVLKESGLSGTPLGRLVFVGSTLGDFAAVLLLSLLFSGEATGTGTRLVLLAMFGLLVAFAAVAVARSGRSMRIGQVLVRLQDSTAQIRVRAAVLLLVGLVVLAEHTGLEAILGAFLAGAVVSLVDRDPAATHPQFRVKLDAIGYGLLIPVFFVSSGMRFDLDALVGNASTLALVPLFLVALLVARGVPAFVYRSQVGSVRATLAAGLLQATSLPFIVTASMIGVEVGALTPATGSAFVAAGLVSALVFPALALGLVGPRPALSSEDGRNLAELLTPGPTESGSGVVVRSSAR